MENSRNPVLRAEQCGLQNSCIVRPFVSSSTVTIKPQNEGKGESSGTVCRHTEMFLPKSILKESTAGATLGDDVLASCKPLLTEEEKTADVKS